MTNAFWDKYPEDFEQMVAEYEGCRPDAYDTLHKDSPKWQLQAAIEAINAAGWTLHPKPPPKTIEVGQAGEKSNA